MKKTNFYFEDQEIAIPVHFFNRSRKITEDTPQIEFLKGIHKTDVEKEIGALRNMCDELSLLNHGIKTVSDLMAGCGFSGRIFQKYLGADLILNDMSPICYEILKINYPKEKVMNEDAFQIPVSGFGDLTFIDFNNFTINKLDFWSKLFKKIAKRSKYLMITDSAVYGFKFGNLKGYGCKKDYEYYEKLGWAMGELGWWLCDVRTFGPATLILFDQEKDTWDDTIVYHRHPCIDYRIPINNRKGLSIV